MWNFKKMLSLTLCSTFSTSFALSLAPSNLSATAASINAVTINPSLQYQTMDGWGTSLAWWGNLVGNWSDEARNEIMNLVFDQEKGLGLNIVRYNIGGGENPEHDHMRIGGEIEGYEPSPGVWDWNADAGQRWVLEQAKEKVPADDFITEAFSNSPPYLMTESKCASGATDGGSNLKDDQYDDFANYFTEVIKHFKDEWGITFDTADPLNEPSSNWWKANGSQEGCHFDASEQARLIKEVYNSLLAKGLTDTKISASDETSIDLSIDTLNSFDEETLSYIEQINTHIYGGSKRAELRDLAASLNKPLYMDEICTGYGNHDHDSMDAGLAIADFIYKDLKDMQAAAWEIWQVVDDEVQDTNGNSNWGLIHAYWSGENAEQYFLTKKYYTLAHFTKFIKPGYTIIDADNSNVLAAYDDDSKNLVIVARNTLNENADFSFDLSKFNRDSSTIKAYRTTEKENLAEITDYSVANNYLSAKLPGKSIVTYVISNAEYDGAIGTVANDNVKGTGSNQFDYGNSSTWSYYNNQSGAYSNDIHYTNTPDDYYKVSFMGNQIKLYGAKANDSGIAAISIDDGQEMLVDMYAAERKDNALLYSSPLLSAGNHTIKVRATGDKNESSSDCFITADRAVSYVGSTDTESLSAPSLTTLSAGDGRLTAAFSAVDGATSYNIKYGESSGEYTKVITDVADNIYNITGLENGKKYYVVVSALSENGETNNSNELAETPVPAKNPHLLYYVNAGDSNPLSLEDGEDFGVRNSNEDQAYKRDAVTGYYWGYLADDDKTWSQDNQASLGSNYGALRQYDGYGKGKGLEYKFEVPNGNYHINLGFYDPWDISNRRQDIIINGNTVENNLVIGKNQLSKAYDYAVTDEMLSIKVACSDDNSDHPIISWITIESVATETSLNSISLTSSKTTLKANDTSIINVNGLMDDGSVSDLSNAEIQFSSSDINIATVDSKGLVTAINDGYVTINAAVTLNGITRESSINLTVDVTKPLYNLSVNGVALKKGESFDDYLPLTFDASDTLSGLKSAEITIGTEKYSLTTSSSTDINFIGKPGTYVAEIRIIDNAGNELKETFNFSVTTSIDSIRYLLNDYKEKGDILGGIFKILNTDLSSAEKHLKEGNKTLAAKHLDNFKAHLAKTYLFSSISKEAQNVLSNDAQYLMDIWSK